MNNKINKCEKEFIKLFSSNFKFSDSLYKYEDKKIYDMYDHNYFDYNNLVTISDISKAINYQKSLNLDFLKLIGKNKLDSNIINHYSLEESITITMLHDNKTTITNINDDILIKNISLNDLNTIELKHYASTYGEDFVKRRNKYFLEKCKEHSNFNYYGAYINNKIVGTCHSFIFDDYTCLDSLLVDDKYRNKYIASTLIKYVKDNSKYLYLHADSEDTPKQMYEKLGFIQVNKTYEYYKKI